MKIPSDYYIPTQHSNMNPFAQPAAFVNSGPDSFLEFGQYESDYYAQTEYVEQPPPPPPKTPIRTPVMGTRTYQHRRTLSNASSQFSNRGVQVDYGEVVNPAEVDYRFHNFTDAMERQPLQFHSVPYSCNHPDTTNAHPIPDRMRLYENVSHFQQHIQESPSRNTQQNQTPVKTSSTESASHDQEFVRTTNSMRREMFFNPDPNPTSPKVAQSTMNGNEISHTNEANANAYNRQFCNSTGCTPTHSTPQDSFSDDSSYLSALSSQNRVRFSPDNFLTDNNVFSPTSRMAVANLQRAMVRRTMELEEGEKS